MQSLLPHLQKQRRRMRRRQHLRRPVLLNQALCLSRTYLPQRVAADHRLQQSLPQHLRL
jgi:hypothetical protein